MRRRVSETIDKYEAMIPVSRFLKELDPNVQQEFFYFMKNHGNYFGGIDFDSRVTLLDLYNDWKDYLQSKISSHKVTDECEAMDNGCEVGDIAYSAESEKFGEVAFAYPTSTGGQYTVWVLEDHEDDYQFKVAADLIEPDKVVRAMIDCLDRKFYSGKDLETLAGPENAIEESTKRTTIGEVKMKKHIGEARRAHVDIDDVYDEFERQGVHYEATKVAHALDEINWRINAEDVPLCLVDLYTHGVNLSSVTTVTYDEDEFTEWLENDQDEFDGGYQVYMLPGLPRRYFGWNYGGSEITELYIQKKVTFTTQAPITESKKSAKKALKEGMGGCFYVIHESPIGYKGCQGWIDDYSELTSDIDSAEHYDTLQTAVDMLYAIEDYVENFNDNEGIRATIQCVNPDADQVMEDIAVVDIQKRYGVVDCEPVSGEQNLINYGYWIEDSEPSMGYNL